MAKYRSNTNYKSIYDGDRGGINLGLDGAVFLKQEVTPRTFQAPSIGTQGKSEGDTGADTDISSGTDTSLQIAVDLNAAVVVTLTVAGKNTASLIAAELELKANAALLAAGYDSRIWVEVVGGDQYVAHSQKTGVGSSVVITDAVSDNIADDLKLGVANGGTETAGVDDQDFLLYTTGGPTFSQPIESNSHRSGRYHSGIIKKKKVAEFNLSTYVNMSGLAGSSLDAAVKLLWKSLLGDETVSGSAIRYRQGLPNFYMSLVRVSTIFAEYYTGAYVRDMNLSFPGDGPAMCEWSGKASKRTIAGIAKINGAVSASANVVLVAGQYKRYDLLAPVMVVDPDGRTILHGADGSLTISTITGGSEQLTLSAAVSVGDGGYIVPWHPGAVQQTGRDAIFTDLQGSFKLNAGGSSAAVTGIELSFTNDHHDFDGDFGSDSNKGFAAAERLTMGLNVTFDLSNENYPEVVQSSQFQGFSPEIILGDPSSGRYLKVTAPKWLPAVPTIEVPESGVTPVTLEGNLFQSVPGAQDPILVEFL